MGKKLLAMKSHAAAKGEFAIELNRFNIQYMQSSIKKCKTEKFKCSSVPMVILLHSKCWTILISHYRFTWCCCDKYISPLGINNILLSNLVSQPFLPVPLLAK